MERIMNSEHNLNETQNQQLNISVVSDNYNICSGCLECWNYLNDFLPKTITSKSLLLWMSIPAK